MTKLRPFSIDAANSCREVARLLLRSDSCRPRPAAPVDDHRLVGGRGIVCAYQMAGARKDSVPGVSEVEVGIVPTRKLPDLLCVIPTDRLAGDGGVSGGWRAIA